MGRRAHWHFDLHQGWYTADSVVISGDGVDDLDRLIDRMQTSLQIGSRLEVDVGGQYSIWLPADIEDVLAIRAQYVRFHRETDRPDTWERPPGRLAMERDPI
jgi:hypothetical protein